MYICTVFYIKQNQSIKKLLPKECRRVANNNWPVSKRCWNLGHPLQEWHWPPRVGTGIEQHALSPKMSSTPPWPLVGWGLYATFTVSSASLLCSFHAPHFSANVAVQAGPPLISFQVVFLTELLSSTSPSITLVCFSSYFRQSFVPHSLCMPCQCRSASNYVLFHANLLSQFLHLPSILSHYSTYSFQSFDLVPSWYPINMSWSKN